LFLISNEKYIIMNDATNIVIKLLSKKNDFIHSVFNVIRDSIDRKEDTVSFVASSIYDILSYEVSSSLEESSDITVELAMLSFNSINFLDLANYFIGEYERQR